MEKYVHLPVQTLYTDTKEPIRGTASGKERKGLVLKSRLFPSLNSP